VECAAWLGFHSVDLHEGEDLVEPHLLFCVLAMSRQMNPNLHGTVVKVMPIRLPRHFLNSFPKGILVLYHLSHTEPCLCRTSLS